MSLFLIAIKSHSRPERLRVHEACFMDEKRSHVLRNHPASDVVHHWSDLHQIQVTIYIYIYSREGLFRQHANYRLRSL